MAELLTVFQPMANCSSLTVAPETRKRETAHTGQRFYGRRYLQRWLTPGEVSARFALTSSLLAMLLVMFFDLVNPAEISLHILYVFPLATIALHCERLSRVVLGLALSVAVQLWSFLHQGLQIGPYMTDGLIVAASFVLTVTLARASRANYLATASLAATDWLTGLANRRSFESAADAEITRQRRYGGVFSLAVIDLDGFKQLNDAKGHQAGDKALRLLADVLRDYTRQTDLTARLGGDEFAVLMPNTRTEDCLPLCRQLVLIIGIRMADAGFAVTASVGCTTFEEAPESTPAALQRADRAMYAAKANGKGCAVSL